MALVFGAQEASSSSNASRSSLYGYHVFLSFRGEDTRKTFTDHLYTAFVNAGFRTFRDDDEVEKGEHIKPELEKAIQQSQSSVIVFSKDYASSRWCLNELVTILKRKRTSDHVVLPVFYDVDPSHVRKQTGSLAKAFARHQKTQSFDTVKEWREALMEAADLAGMVLQNEADGHESKFIKKIVGVVEDKLRRIPFRVDPNGPNLISIHDRAKNINLWLQDGSNKVEILVIFGMRGIGKTTIAKFVYDYNLIRFQGCSFLENIREISAQTNGLIQIQKQLLHDILNGRKVKIRSVSEGIVKIEEAISSKRVLLVVDDVDCMDQLDGLLRIQSQFYPGSKIIITTSNAGLLNSYRQAFQVHNVETMNENESLELFSLHAFGQDHPIESYMDHSRRLVEHCGGLPLALKILGSSLSGKDIAVWESALKKIVAIPNGQILKKLKISYDSLQDSHDQDLFLHIACFFVGMNKDVIVRILDGCDFFTDVGIQNLIDRYLVTIDEYNNKVQMHHMIQDMGRGIVRLESKEPGERSRLWHHKDSFKVLTENNGSPTIEGLVLNMKMHPAYTSSRNSNEPVVLETNAFSRMHRLRLLQLSYVQLNGSYSEFPMGLRWLCWVEFPFDSLPSDFPLASLVALEMCYSSLREVWKRTEYLPSLKILNLSHSGDLIETPDFSPVPNLEWLNLEDCPSLVDVHESIGSLERLVYLNIKDCKNIRKLPYISSLTSLETLTISGCTNLNVFPTEIRKLESLRVFQADGVPLDRFLTTTGEVTLCLRNNLEISGAFSLPRNLVYLSLRNCNLSDEDFPTNFVNLSSLQGLDLSRNPICSLPEFVRDVTRLRNLRVEGCTRLKSLIRLPCVDRLDMLGCKSLERITFQSFREYSKLRSWSWDMSVKINEFEYKYKLEPIERVDPEMINLLGLSTNCFTETIMTETRLNTYMNGTGRRPIQGLHECGVFSTFIPGNEVPQYGSYSHKSNRGSSISFTVPLLPNCRIRGLNIFSVYATPNSKIDSPNKIHVHKDLRHPMITKVINKSKDLKSIYRPSVRGVPGDGQDVTWLSHWMCGHKLEGGDEVTVYTISQFQVKEWGIQLVYYEQGAEMSTTERFFPNMLDSVWYNSDDTEVFDEITDEEEEQRGDCTLAAQRSRNSDSSGGRGWKVVMIMAAVFFFSFSGESK